jgi:hypothetical protein
MTDTDKIEELAKTFDGTLSPIVSEDELKVADFLRSLSTKLKELEEKAEALEWLLKRLPMSMAMVMVISEIEDLPPYLRKRLGKEG